MEGDPDLSHVKDYEHVYEPAEDSFLLIDAFKADYDSFLKRRLPTTHVPLTLEVGCGSGVVTAGVAMQMGVDVATHIATDINPHAARTAERTFAQNGVRHAEVVLTDLVAAVLPRLRRKVDVLLFNPPYVPTPPEEMEGCGISVSWAGGERGREVLDRLLPLVDELLSDNGVFYLVVLKQNDPDEIASILAESAGLRCVTIKERRAGSESLGIQRYWRAASDAADACGIDANGGDVEVVAG
jgi:release factor glutamine methyltransferase